MTCCWERLFFEGDVLQTDATLQDHRWWDDPGGLVNMAYYETQSVLTPKSKQAAFLSGRPGWLGPVTIDDSLQLPNRDRQDVWRHLSEALGRELFHGGRWLRREPVFSNGELANCDFMRTARYSRAGGTLRVLFVLIPPLFYEPVHVGNDQLGGSSQASEFPSFGQFQVFNNPGTVEERRDVVQRWRDQTNFDDVLDGWARRENQKVADNPSTVGFAGWRTELQEIRFDDIAYFGGSYGLQSAFYRANGGQRLLVEVDATRPPHHDIAGLPIIDPDNPTDPQHNEFVPVVVVSLNAWDSARSANVLPGESTPELPSAGYMAGLAIAAVHHTDSTLTIEGWFNKNRQPPGGTVAITINGHRVLVDPREQRDWTAFFRGLMTWQNVQDYSPPTGFKTGRNDYPSGYEDLVSVVQERDASYQGESAESAEVFNDGDP